MTASERVEAAFQRLAEQPGFRERPDQRQLALLMSDCIESSRRGMFEAPTGLGKSLASLIPAFANAIHSGKRTVIATYTNVLAEQYWRNDMPLAAGLFEEQEAVKRTFLIGKQRYACLAQLETERQVFQSFADSAELGTEAEFRQWAGTQRTRDLLKMWPQVVVPPVCQTRNCPHYNACYYYKARREAEKAHIIITNHSVVIQDALLRQASDGEQTLLGDYDFLILDEAHDFLQAAQNGLEVEITEAKLDQTLGLAQRLFEVAFPAAKRDERGEAFTMAWVIFGSKWKRGTAAMRQVVPGDAEAAFLRIAPEELKDHPALKTRMRPDLATMSHTLAKGLANLIDTFLVEVRLQRDHGDNADLVRSYSLYLSEAARGLRALFDEGDPSAEVTYGDGGEMRPARLRRDLVDLAGVLRPLVWNKKPWVALSATLAIDGTFDWFVRSSGADSPDFSDILPSPFDFAHQAALYVPPLGKLLDPSEARKTQREEEYWYLLSLEISEIIRACEGRTLVLFPSRREMEEVHRRLPDLGDLKVLIQRGQGAAATGAKFKKEISSSLFALRSFWTGFDAPGETCFCVALTRVPFEPPTDPVAMTRMAWMQRQGLDPFLNHTLPQAKMMMRQGTGRLIRRVDDQGIIALLDPRLRTKSYGEQIFENLPAGMRSFDDIVEAVAHLATR